MAGYGIRNDVVKAIQDDARKDVEEEKSKMLSNWSLERNIFVSQIQKVPEDALNSLLNRLYVPTIKIIGKGDDAGDYPMTVEERIEYLLEKEKALTQVKIRLNALSVLKTPADFAVDKADDAYEDGIQSGEVFLARELKKILDA